MSLFDLGNANPLLAKPARSWGSPGAGTSGGLLTRPPVGTQPPLTWVGDRGVQPAGWPQNNEWPPQNGGNWQTGAGNPPELPGNNNPNLPSPGVPQWNAMNIPTQLQQLIARRAGMNWPRPRMPRPPFAQGGENSLSPFYPQIQSAIAANPNIMTQFGPQLQGTPWWAGYQSWNTANPQQQPIPVPPIA